MKQLFDELSYAVSKITAQKYSTSFSLGILALSPTIILLYLGTLQDLNYLFFIGLGILLYGMCYFFVHDIFIHQRIKYFSQTKTPYFLALRRAHKQHHKHTAKHNGECSGFLYVPFKYFKMYFKKSV